MIQKQAESISLIPKPAKMAKTEISISNNLRKGKKVMIFGNDKIATALAAKSGAKSTETEKQAKEKCKTRVSWTVGQLLL